MEENSAKDVVIAKDKKALYFGCIDDDGHFLFEHGRGSRATRDYCDDHKDGFPWTWGQIDTTLLNNRKVSDYPDGRVHVICGGSPLWIGFFWWDRTGDSRPGSNSGFYVTGFTWDDRVEAFKYACEQWPEVVQRQNKPLVLLDPPAVLADKV